MGGEITSPGGLLEEDRSPGLKAEPSFISRISNLSRGICKLTKQKLHVRDIM